MMDYLFRLLGWTFLVYIMIYTIGRQKPNSHKIKYDCRDRKLFLILAIIFTVLSIGALILSKLPDLDQLSSEMIVLIFLGGLMFGPILTLSAWLLFLNSTLYLRRLKAYGYEVPTNKKDFSSRLDKLPKVEGNFPAPTGDSKESIALSMISLSAFAGIVINAIVFYFKYRDLGDLKYMGMWGSAPLFLFWLIIAFVFRRQRLREKYKDNVEIDEKRKNRKQIEEGIVEIIIYLIITVIWIAILYNWADYVYKSRLEAGYYQSYGGKGYESTCISQAVIRSLCSQYLG